MGGAELQGVLAVTRSKRVLLAGVLLALCAPAARAQTPPPDAAGAQAGGREYGQDDPLDMPLVPGSAAARIVDGVAHAPADAPDAVKQVIWAANRIVGLPYRFGGGHGEGFEDSAYDCSGAISFALHGAELLRRPRSSVGFLRFGQRGTGAWVTIHTRASHAYLTVAGIRLDTSAADDPGGDRGPRWRPLRGSDAGYTARRPVGL